MSFLLVPYLPRLVAWEQRTTVPNKHCVNLYIGVQIFPIGLLQNLSNNTNGRHEGSNANGRHEGSNANGRHEGSNANGRHEGSNANGRHEGSNANG